MTDEERIKQFEICLEQLNELLSFTLMNRNQEIGACPSDLSPFFEEGQGAATNTLLARK